MSDVKINILEAIDIAIEAEQNAHKFYLDAIEKVSNQRGKILLKQLSDFELNHYNKLNEFKSSLKDGEYIKYSGTEFTLFKIENDSEITGKIEENKNDVLHILSKAIEAETNASERYQKLANQIDNANGKEMFHKLAEEELLHRRILSDEFYQLSNNNGEWFWGD